MVTVKRAALLPALIAVTKAVSSRHTIPILDNLLIETKENWLRITATNLDQQISVAIDCKEAIEPISNTIPALAFYGIVRALPEDAAIDVNFLENNINITSGTSKFTLQTLPSKDFPSLESDEDWNCKINLSSEALERINTQVCFVISPDDSRYYLNGVHLHGCETEPQQITAVATDGHRLARLQIMLSEPLDNMPGIIVPTKFWQIVKGLFKGNKPIVMRVNKSKVAVTQDNITIISKLVDGIFPEYERVIPQNNVIRYFVNRAALIAAVERCLTICSNKAKCINFNFNNKKLQLLSRDPEHGQAEDEVPLEPESANDILEIGFNGGYVTGVLSACTSDRVELLLGTNTDPTIIRTLDDPDALFVLMPMRI